MGKTSKPTRVKIPFKKIDTSTVILGFMGPIASGSSYISETIPKVAAAENSYLYYKMSDGIRSVLHSEGNEFPTIAELQDKGNQLRREQGRGYLVSLVLKRAESDWQKGKHYGIVLDGIKNATEVSTLQQFPNFFLFSVQADKQVRCVRALEDGLFPDATAFDEADLRDALEADESGQQVSTCNYLADIVLLNNENIAKQAQRKKEEFVRTNVYEKYVRLIENLHDGSKSPEIKPSIDEACMTMAYVLSKSSSCLKRGVGAVIALIDELSPFEDSAGRHMQMPSIVSSGYNEVPLGSHMCVFHPDYGMCCRDYLQEKHAKGLKHCPTCGKKIKLAHTCTACGQEHDTFVNTCKGCRTETKVTYICKCGTNVFETFAPGGKGSPGKMLDMCRALHAKEIALLKLARGGRNTGDNLVLYCTTQPCNLCSNKIVAAGIAEVVFNEPYSMIEAQETLESADVRLRRFEGVKSRAYFRLYA